MRKFGLELEMCEHFSVYGEHISQNDIKAVINQHSDRDVHCPHSWTQTHNNDYWHVKEDGSCGWEVASFIASSANELKQIANVADALNDAGATADTSCGFHIHVDASDLTPAKVAVIAARWLKLETFLLQSVPLYRKNNFYCKPLNSVLSRKIKKGKVYTSKSFWDDIRPNRFSPHDNFQKRTTLNLVNYAANIHYQNKKRVPYYGSRNTLEFRLPEGTLKSNEIINWTMFFINFVDYVKDTKFPANFESVTSLRKFFSMAGLGRQRIENDMALLNVKLFFINRLNKFGLSYTNQQITDFIF